MSKKMSKISLWLLLVAVCGFSNLLAEEKKEEGDAAEEHKATYTVTKAKKCKECTKESACEACVTAIKEAFKSVDGVTSVELEEGIYTVTMSKKLKSSVITKAMSKAGFKAKTKRVKKKKE